MMVRIGAIDGNTYESRNISDEEMLEHLASVDNDPWHGDGPKVYTADEAYESMKKIMDDNIEGYTNESITIHTADGHALSFTADKIVWHEVIR